MAHAFSSEYAHAYFWFTPLSHSSSVTYERYSEWFLQLYAAQSVP